MCLFVFFVITSAAPVNADTSAWQDKFGNMDSITQAKDVALNRQFPRVAQKPDVRINPGENRGYFPDIVRCANGDLLAAWHEPQHGNHPKGRAMAAWSTDGGKTWSKPVVIYDKPGWDERMPRPFVARDGTIWCGFECRKIVGGKIADEKTYAMWSTDNGRNWHGPVDGGEVACAELADGTVLFASNFEPTTNPAALATGRREHRFGRAIGRLRKTATGYKYTNTPAPELGGANEWDFIETNTPGRLVAMMRQVGVFVDSAIYSGPYYFTSISKDYGKTWKKLWPSQVWHSARQSRPNLEKLHDGTIVCVHDERSNRRVMLTPSFDDGESWDVTRKLPVLEGLNGDFAYP